MTAPASSVYGPSTFGGSGIIQPGFGSGMVAATPRPIPWERVLAYWGMGLVTASAGGQQGCLEFITSLVIVYEPPEIARTGAAVASRETEVESTTSCEQALTLPIADQVREVSAALSLNKSRLAEILGVSRPTLYAWLDGSTPGKRGSDRLLKILKIISRAGVSSDSPLNARFIRNPLAEGDMSLIDLLKTETCNEEKITSVLKSAKKLSAEALERVESREKRWRRLGYQELSFEERKATLDRNIAALHFDRSK